QRPARTRRRPPSGLRLGGARPSPGGRGGPGAGGGGRGGPGGRGAAGARRGRPRRRGRRGAGGPPCRGRPRGARAARPRGRRPAPGAGRAASLWDRGGSRQGRGFEGVEAPLEALERADDVVVHRAGGEPHRLGDLLVAEGVEAAEHEGLALLRRQLVYPGTQEAAEAVGVERVAREVGGRRGFDLGVLAGVEAGVAEVAERAVPRHAEEEGGQRLRGVEPVAQRPEPLEDVLHEVVREGVVADDGEDVAEEAVAVAPERLGKRRPVRRLQAAAERAARLVGQRPGGGEGGCLPFGGLHAGWGGAMEGWWKVRTNSPLRPRDDHQATKTAPTP